MIDWHANEMDTRYASIRQQILERDDFTCAYCDFRSPKYQHVHHLNDDHAINKPENLATACPLCHQCFHLGLAGVHNSGVMIYLPELTQAQLNNLVRTCFVAIANKGENEEAARAIYASLENRSFIIEETFGPGTSNPSAFGQAFVEMPQERYESREKRLPGLRLLPKQQAFAAEIAYWQSEPTIFGKFKDADWKSLVPVLETEPDQEQLASDEDAGDHETGAGGESDYQSII